MGYGSYSHDAHVALTQRRKSKGRGEVFTQRTCHPLMNPKGVRYRESRDSGEHPESLGIIFALDVTGSMGEIPEALATETLPDFMKALLSMNVSDPQVLFMAVGDATCDDAPLQVGQFESEAELMDKWLTLTFLEGGGGGQGTESYELGMYFAARHTLMDCYEKRQKKGYLFMTGDEFPYDQVSREQVQSLIGDDLARDIPIEQIVEEVQKKFHTFFLIPDKYRAEQCGTTWRKLLGDNVIVMHDSSLTSMVAAALVGLTEGVVRDAKQAYKLLVDSGVGDRSARLTRQAVESYAKSLAR